MSTNQTTYLERLLNQIQLRVAESEVDLASTFTRLFWARTLEEDFAQRSVSDDAGATIEAWRRLRDRRPDAVQIMLSNPVHARNGWQSSHTIVQLMAPNMPFMVDSVLMALSQDGLVTHHLNNAVFAIDRDASGVVKDLSLDTRRDNRELLVYAELDRLADEDLPALKARLQTMTSELQAVVGDFGTMKQGVMDALELLRNEPPSLPPQQITEGIAFLEWLLDDHFTFLGCREFEYADGVIRQVGTPLGMQSVRTSASERKLADQSESTRKFLMAPTLLSFSKSGTKSRVHRPAYPDYVGVKRFNDKGEVIGELGILGLYTSRAYVGRPVNIPVIRRKVANVLTRSNLDLTGFDGKVLAEVLNTYPRDELFQIEEDELLDTALIITDIHERRRVRVFVRYAAYGLFVTTLVYLPRDLFNTQVREKLDDLLVTTFDAEDADHDIYLSESILVRLQFTLRIRPGARPQVDRIDLEKRIVELIVDWQSELHGALVSGFGEAKGRTLARQYQFPAGYQEQFTGRAAVDDIAAIEALNDNQPLSTLFYKLPEDAGTTLRLKIYHFGEQLPLSDLIPKLENMGLRVNGVHPYDVGRGADKMVVIHDFELVFAEPLNLAEAGAHFGEAFLRVWNGAVEDDSYNRLILGAGMDWRQVSVLRAYGQYMKQIRFGFSQAFISDTLNTHSDIAEQLVRYFECRFQPSDAASQDEQPADERVVSLDDLAALRLDIIGRLENVALLNEDRILRRFLELMDATRRTNYFVVDNDGAPRAFLSLKLFPADIASMPKPLPMFEVFVSAPYFEGVHLRGGPIARGGLRWSDRLEDYRTEVLGLVKAQVVKNAVIVPTGAKGGFVLKGEREGVECYRDFIRGLLDLTDNLVDGEIVPPARVRRFDADDPYLVVAADKGTATFSDEANAVAESFGFWLGDAFASGGSYGYDHKKMGITAKGAWVSVQRHFAEQDIDVQSESITVLGIGDMSGDVFGNGMLLSRCLKVIGAFNHRDIFIDPTPNTEATFVERERLFALPRSSWQDFDTTLISEGGGIFPRTLKSIGITPQMKSAFGISENALSPDDLINRLLKSPVQLIWNGGIGTYVKATSETHDDAGDRANDHLRVDASDLRCVAFGEGGNLGMTQRARVEFGLQGGAVNSDFIDNSAGVDCSDHEVNIKVLLNEAVAAQDMTLKQRNELLVDMTNDVSNLVLANNYQQSQCLSLAQRHSSTRQDEYQRFVQYMSAEAGLDRELERLPSEEQLADRFAAGKGLTRPELAILLAYSKTHIKNHLIDSAIHEDPVIAEEVFAPFPERLVNEHRARLLSHRLNKEIIATQLANDVVDHMGITFVVHSREFAGGSVEDVVRAYAAVSRCYSIGQWFDEVAAVDSVSAELKLAILLELMRLGRRATRWVLRHRHHTTPVHELVERFQSRLQTLVDGRDSLIGVEGGAWRERVAALREAGLPELLAQKSVNAAALARLMPIIDVADRTGCDPLSLATTTSAVAHELQLDWLSRELARLAASSHWQAMERDSLLDDLTMYQCRIAASVLSDTSGADLPEAEKLTAWLAEHTRFVGLWGAAIEQARHTTEPDFSMYSMLTRRLGDLFTGL